MKVLFIDNDESHVCSLHILIIVTLSLLHHDTFPKVACHSQSLCHSHCTKCTVHACLCVCACVCVHVRVCECIGTTLGGERCDKHCVVFFRGWISKRKSVGILKPTHSTHINYWTLHVWEKITVSLPIAVFFRHTFSVGASH